MPLAAGRSVGAAPHTLPTRARRHGVYIPPRLSFLGFSMQVMKLPLLVAGALLTTGAARLGGQQAAPPDPTPLAVGTMAPDFTVTGATRYGVLARPVHLSEFRGTTVVLAFFFKARTKG